MKNAMEILINQENKEEAEQINTYIRTLNTERQSDLLMLLKGVQLGMSMAKEAS